MEHQEGQAAWVCRLVRRLVDIPVDACLRVKLTRSDEGTSFLQDLI